MLQILYVSALFHFHLMQKAQGMLFFSHCRKQQNHLDVGCTNVYFSGVPQVISFSQRTV